VIVVLAVCVTAIYLLVTARFASARSQERRRLVAVPA
jgi:hypothetical protein